MNKLPISWQAYHYLRSKLQLLHCLHTIPHFGKRWEDVNWNYQYVIDILSILFWKTSFDVQLIIATLHSFCFTNFRCQAFQQNFPIKSSKFSNYFQGPGIIFDSWNCIASILPCCMLQSQWSPSEQSLIIYYFQGVLWDCGYHNIPHWMNNSLHCFDQ